MRDVLGQRESHHPVRGSVVEMCSSTSFCDSLSYFVEISQHDHEGTHVDLRILAVALPGHVRREC